MELALPYTERKLVTIQLLRDEANEAFKLWKTSNDKIEY